MSSFSEKYHEESKYHPETMAFIPMPDWNEQPLPFKLIDDSAECLSLAPYLGFDPYDSEELEHSLSQQDSTNLEFGKMELLARIAYFTAGITRSQNTPGGTAYERTTPSAGGIYPCELIIAVRDWDLLPDGIYEFHPLLCSLVKLEQEFSWEDFGESLFGHESVESAKLAFIQTGLLHRGVWRFQERTYRRLLGDCGSLAANTLAICEAFRLHTTYIPCFHDIKLAELLQLNLEKEIPLTVITIGPNVGTDGRYCFIKGATKKSERDARSSHPFNQHQSLQKRQYSHECMIEFENPAGIQEPMQFYDMELDFSDYAPITTSKTAGFFKKYADFSIFKRILRRKYCKSFKDGILNDYSVFSLLATVQNKLSPFCIPEKLIHQHFVSFQTDGIPPAQYLLDRGNHKLLLECDLKAEATQNLQKICMNQESLENSSAAILYCVNLKEAVKIFGERAYRYLLMECGMWNEFYNLYAEEHSMNFTGVTGFFDDEIRDTFCISDQEVVLSIAVFGSR